MLRSRSHSCAEDGFNCGRSFLTEAPVLEDMNVSFDSLSKPLPFDKDQRSYTANTEGQLEQDISDFFNAMVKIFNELFEAEKLQLPHLGEVPFLNLIRVAVAGHLA
eukprot:Skav219916  [mRNA]  locus=scaffold2006:45540:46156:- [translate_table: standard]